MADMNTQRMLVLHAGSLGDCVLAIHFAAALARERSMAVTLVARSGFAEWAADRGFVGQALRWEYGPAREIFRDECAYSPNARQWFSEFDMLVSLLGPEESAAGRRLAALEHHQIAHIDPRPVDDPRLVPKHIVLQWAYQAAGQGINVEVEHLLRSISLPFDRTEFQRSLAERLGAARAIALVHPGSGGLHKCVPLERLETAVRTLSENCAVSPAWIIGPDELERFGPEYVRRLERSAPVVFEESISRAADVVAGAAVYAGHDAGMTHVAAMIGVPTIALFGPTDPRVWRPIGHAVEVVSFPREADDDLWPHNLAAHIVHLASGR